MINLRLTNTDDSADKTQEFYNGKNPISFLGGIKDLNIIVGANNTRKSRFMRSIIKISHKVTVETDADINNLIYEAPIINEELSALSVYFQSGIIEFIHYHTTDHDSNVLSTYFDQKNMARRTITVELLKEQIDGIVNNYLHAVDDSSADHMIQSLEVLNILSKAILYLFRFFKSKHHTTTAAAAYPEGPFQYMLTTMPGHAVGQEINGLDEMIEVAEKMLNWSAHFKKLTIQKFTRDTIYIPALRTSRQLYRSNNSSESDDIFALTIKDNYFKKETRVQIDTGMKLYQHIQYARNGNREEIRNFHAFEKFIGETFFGSDDIHIIPYRGRNEEKDFIKISLPGEIENVAMHDLGEGVQAVINLLFPIFTAQDKQWIFIDEPENNLHPGFQNIFINAITQNTFLKKKQLRYFINTHSNHILSESFLSGMEPAIFVFSKRDEQSTEISHFDQNEYRTLELLGVMNTSVLITNCSIWVEGITDRFYIRAFLFAYCKSLPSGSFVPKEGFDYSFVEYGGKNLVHYDFDQKANDNIAAYFINSNVFLLADKDFDDKKEQKYSKIKRKNFRFEQTDLPEIENLVPDQILKDFLSKEVGCDESGLEKIFPIKSHDRKLGAIFDGVTKNGKKISLKAESGGTLVPSYKLRLSQFVYSKILDDSYQWKDFETSQTLKRIVEALYDFIKTTGRKK